MTTTTLPRLTRSHLATVRAELGRVVDMPSEALLELPERVVQFGTGGFLRGFLDDFIHRANVQGTFDGRIVAVGSTGSNRDRALTEQDGLYTLVVEGIENGQQMQEVRVISSLSRALSAVDDWQGVLEVARNPELKYVFSNTTEVGIMLHPTDGPDDAPPSSFPAKLTRFLYERGRTFGYDEAHGVTVVPCELIENNGDKLKDIVLALAERWELGEDFYNWVSDEVPFCNTLVDRIVPGAPRDESIERLNNLLGYEDALLTCCEPYRLLAIEGGDELRSKLTWASADPGIIIAQDIAPYRKRKVHLLNGAHTLFIPVALQMGFELVRDAINDPSIGKFVYHAMHTEIAPTLNVEGADAFADAVLDRFRNPFIKHALFDITLQAVMKTRVRIVPTIQRYIAEKGEVPQSLAFGFAAFLLFAQGKRQAERKAQGLKVPADDQIAQLQAHWEGFPEDASAPVDGLVEAVCRDATLWGVDLTQQPGFCEAVAQHLSRMRTQGMRVALEHHIEASVT
ncbi:MAG: tagaturonate reductase [Gemmatimonadota bacterium]